MQEKKLRKIVSALLELRKTELCGMAVTSQTWEYAWQAAAEALSATTDETEMEKLMAWLKDCAVFARNYINNEGDYCYEVNVFDEVVKYITTQFGEEEGDADREGD